MASEKCYSFNNLNNLSSKSLHKTVYTTTIKDYSNNDRVVTAPSSQSAIVGQRKPYLRSKTTVTIANTGRLPINRQFHHADLKESLKSKSAIFEENVLKKHSFRKFHDFESQTPIDCNTYKFSSKFVAPVCLPIKRLDKEYTTRKEAFKKIEKKLNTNITNTSTKFTSNTCCTNAINAKSCPNIATYAYIPETKQENNLVKSEPGGQKLKVLSHKLNIKIGISSPVKQIKVTCRAQTTPPKSTTNNFSNDSACKKDQTVSWIYCYSNI